MSVKTHSKVTEKKKRERKGREERETERQRFAEIDGYDGCG